MHHFATSQANRPEKPYHSMLASSLERVWNYESRQMIYLDRATHLEIYHDGTWNVYTRSEESDPPLIVAICQTAKLLRGTGLRDAQGIALYDGDVIKLFDFLELELIAWVDLGFWLLSIESESTDPQQIPHNALGIVNCMLLGNIYEHPEWDRYSMREVR